MGCTSSRVVPDKVVAPMLVEDKTDVDERIKVLETIDDDIDKIMVARAEAKPLKALFLGTGESGKSTIFKQMRLSYGTAFSKFERDQYAKLIWVDTMRAMREILEQIIEEGLDRAKLDAQTIEWIKVILSLNLSNRMLLEMEADLEAKRFLGNHMYRPDRTIDKEMEAEAHERALAMLPGGRSKIAGADRKTIADAIEGLWTTFPRISEIIERPRLLNLDTNIPYFFDRVQVLADVHYLASDDDILHARLKTTGITETTFDVKANDLVVVDVGGQRTERKKWLHTFEDVTCVLFVVAVSEYDELLAENMYVNRLVESFEVFKQTMGSKWLQDKPVAVFFNKIDILEKKLKISSFGEYHTDYTGDPNSSKEVIDYIEKRLRKSVKGRTASMYTYRTSATDRQAMKFVVDAVTDMIFVENMKSAGLF